MAIAQWCTGALILAAHFVSSYGDNETVSSPPPPNVIAIVKENTNNYHLGRNTAAVFNTSSDETLGSPVQSIVSSAVSNVTSPAPSVPSATKKPALGPTGGLLFGANGEVFGDGDWSFGNSKYAVPALIIIILAFLAGLGFFVVYWRRKRASNYYGLKEAELNSVQMHRS